MRLNEPGESIVVVPVGRAPTAETAAAEVQAYEERFLFLLLLLRQPRLRVIYVTGRAGRRRASSTTTSRCCPASSRSQARAPAAHGRRSRRLAAPAGDQAAGAAAPARRDPRALIPDPHALPPRAVHHDRRSSATSRWRSASRCTAPIRACSARHQDRLPAALRARRAWRTRSAARTCSSLDGRSSARSPRCARPSRACASAIVKLNEGVSGPRQRVVDLRGLPAPGAAERARARAARARRADAVRAPEHRASMATSPQLAERRRDRRGADRRRGAAQPERPAARDAARRASSCSRPTTSCSAARAGRATSAAGSPPTPAYAAAITREAAKVGERLAREGVLGRFAVDFVVVRDDAGRVGRRTRSRSTCARAARRTRSSRCSS